MKLGSNQWQNDLSQVLTQSRVEGGEEACHHPQLAEERQRNEPLGDDDSGAFSPAPVSSDPQLDHMVLHHVFHKVTKNQPVPEDEAWLVNVG